MALPQWIQVPWVGVRGVEGLVLEARGVEGLVLKVRGVEGLVLKVRGVEGLVLKVRGVEGLVLEARVWLSAPSGSACRLGEGASYRQLCPPLSRSLPAWM